MTDLHVVVLAAGKGTRMRSSRPKVLHPVSGRPMLDLVLRAARFVNPKSVTVVLGHQGETVRAAYADQRDLSFVTQEPQLGTGHALLQAEPLLRDASGDVLLLYGDVPLLRGETLASLVARHREDGAAATVVTATMDQPYGYGRIVRRAGAIARIVEERDASPAERAIKEVNAGIYAFALGAVFDAIRSIASQNVQGEYYLPDLVSIYRKRKLVVSTLPVASWEIRGVNSRRELAEVGNVVRQTKNEELMAAGVTIVDPATAYIETGVVIGADTIVQPNVYLEGRTVIGSACEIQSGVRLVNATIGDRVTVRNYSIITDSEVADGAVIGPFAHIRPGSLVQQDAHVGNFVELKKTTFGRGSKASHLSYLGDATIGEGVNIGAGTITCNYDGVKKQQTTIRDGAFIGSDSQLVAPVTVGEGAYVAAGSTVVQDVPDGALAIARSRQTNKDGWAKRRKG